MSIAAREEYTLVYIWVNSCHRPLSQHYYEMLTALWMHHWTWSPRSEDEFSAMRLQVRRRRHRYPENNEVFTLKRDPQRVLAVTREEAVQQAGEEAVLRIEKDLREWDAGWPTYWAKYQIAAAIKAVLPGATSTLSEAQTGNPSSHTGAAASTGAEGNHPVGATIPHVNPMELLFNQPESSASGAAGFRRQGRSLSSMIKASIAAHIQSPRGKSRQTDSAPHRAPQRLGELFWEVEQLMSQAESYSLQRGDWAWVMSQSSSGQHQMHCYEFDPDRPAGPDRWQETWMRPLPADLQPQTYTDFDEDFDERI